MEETVSEFKSNLFVLNTFISSMIQNGASIEAIVLTCKHIVHKYADSNINLSDLKGKKDIPITTLANIDKSNDKYNLSLVENIFGDEKIGKVFIQVGEKLTEIGNITPQDRLTVYSRDESHSSFTNEFTKEKFSVELQKGNKIVYFEKTSETLSSPISVILPGDYSCKEDFDQSSEVGKKEKNLKDTESDDIFYDPNLKSYYRKMPKDFLDKNPMSPKECIDCNEIINPEGENCRRFLGKFMYYGIIKNEENLFSIPKITDFKKKNENPSKIMRYFQAVICRCQECHREFNNFNKKSFKTIISKKKWSNNSLSSMDNSDEIDLTNVL